MECEAAAKKHTTEWGHIQNIEDHTNAWSELYHIMP